MIDSNFFQQTIRYIAILTALLMASGAWGAPITWTLNNVTFLEEGVGVATAAGAFDYDASGSLYSNINITVTDAFDLAIGFGGLNADPYTYTPDTIILSSATTLRIRDESISVPFECEPTCSRILGLLFDAPLTNAGGSISLLTGEFGSFETLTNEGQEYIQYATAGTVTASAVPIPASVWLFGSALGLLAWMRRKAA